ncbi:hypothetical protein [Scytonema millei]|uniref:Uncharacterized protein n=1 Tax=Scytonema millei VB511283 TaxID=1245923 RepID=A0A9X5E2U6_9CYAN|nr:hypothetical protein [Scytonema millei]NHC34059.1 hypothetical protein [Scytonema millei VB511283]
MYIFYKEAGSREQGAGSREQGAERATQNSKFKILYTPQRQLLMGGDEVRDSATPKTALAPLHPFFTDN